ncbi:CBU_0592 family membrane protein [Flavivirga spongiicola]|uniref:CBU-0592-like domain-containing protein n=1 Tax=Flavivirga spongiicola TaxID=421621 RepID=A0ABU7XRT5_9FLAO|nr:hypothetical protein [Flavivirga sp. MEBiC05379]MDO5978241.1 hypothetical protein [Flavivirga sp. MEBiC05379]
MTIFEIIGWTGAVSYLLSYFLLSFNKLKPNSISYQLMNVIGGFCLVVSAYSTRDNPNLVTNFVWMCIGLIALFSIIMKRKR